MGQTSLPLHVHKVQQSPGINRAAHALERPAAERTTVFFRNCSLWKVVGIGAQMSLCSLGLNRFTTVICLAKQNAGWEGLKASLEIGEAAQFRLHQTP